MEMTNEEIRRYYKQAKDKSEALIILSDMNCCRRAVIKNIINGADIKPLGNNHKNPKDTGKDDFISNFVKSLNEIMTEKQMSSKELADASGICPSAISYYINGKRLPDIYSIYKMAEALEVTIDRMVN